MKICFITDSASDIPQTQGDITVLPMKIMFGETTYEDGVNLTHEQFYDKLIETDVLPTTSQANPGEFGQAIRDRIDDYDAIIIITVSSKLSGTCQSAMIAAADFPGKVFVVDSLSATVGQRILAEYGMQLAAQGKTAEETVEILNREKEKITVIAMLDTLEYLKKGGRISAGAALAGTVLSIKPAVTIEDGSVVMLGKARGSRQVNNFLNTAIEKKGIDYDRPVWLGYTGNDRSLLDKYIADSRHLWKDHYESLPVMTVGGAIGTHVGPGAIAVGFFSK